MSEYSGLTATATIGTSNIRGIVLDSNSCAVNIATLGSRAAKDMRTNTYYTVREYTTEWVLWDDVVIDMPNIEVYKIAIKSKHDTALSAKEFRYVEGEVYSFKHDNMTCRLGISRTINENAYVTTDLLTGAMLDRDNRIECLRCRLPRIAKKLFTEVMTTDMYKDFLKSKSSIPVANSFHTISLYKDNDYPF